MSYPSVFPRPISPAPVDVEHQGDELEVTDAHVADTARELYDCQHGAGMFKARFGELVPGAPLDRRLDELAVEVRYLLEHLVDVGWTPPAAH